MTLTLIIAFAIFVFLFALAIVFSGWPRWLKGMLTLGVVAFYFYGYQAVFSLLGNPSADPVPPRFLLIAAVVEEPRPKYEGAVYLWLTPIEEGKQSLEPRAYKLPYMRALHEKINEGMRKGRQGVSQMGTAEPRLGAGKGPSWLNPGQDEQEIKIMDLPVPQVPEK
jgi:hypothetical protein